MTAGVEMRHLRAFLAVADAASFTRAAERLHVSQPSISQQIRDLEEALGASLFHRLGKSVRLTQAGLAFREGAEVVVRKLEDACAAVERVEGMLSGHLHIGAIPVVGVPWIPPVLARFSVEHPGVTITVHERPSNEIETEVEAGRLDVGVGVLSYASPNVAYERFASAQIDVIVPEGHALAAKEEVSIRDLESVRLLLLPESFQIREMVEEAFRHAKCRPRVAYEIDAIDALLAAVARTGAPTLLPGLVLHGRGARGLRAIELHGHALRLDLGLMWPSASPRSPAAKLFGELVAEVATHAPEGADATAERQRTGGRKAPIGAAARPSGRARRPPR